MRKGKLTVVAGGQYGSEGKGAVAGWLASRSGPASDLLAVRIGGSNAGHTVIGRCPGAGSGEDAEQPCPDHKPDEHPWRLRHVPVAAVTAPGSLLHLAAGSEIDIPVLLDEIVQLDSAGYQASSRLTIDRTATVVTPENQKDEERLTKNIGSTGKGIGAARAMRALREAPLAGQSEFGLAQYLAACPDLPAAHLAQGGHVLIEGTQGYGLGQHAGFYPYVTSQDCRPIDFMSQAGVSPWQASNLEVWLVFRAFPIRVAGSSGPLRYETTWKALGLPEEKTTVTRKVRRVGAWDPDLARRAIAAAGGPGEPVRIALTMADHLLPAIAGADKWTAISTLHRRQLADRIRAIETDLDADIDFLGTGPASAIYFGS